MAKEKKVFDIEDPLAGFGFDVEDEAEEMTEEVEEEIEEAGEELFEESEEKAEETFKQPSPIKEVFAPIGEMLKESAGTPISSKKGGRIMALVSIAAVLAAVLGFIIYSNVTAKSGVSVSQWAKRWNAISYTDMTLSSNTDIVGIRGAELFKDTEHMKLTKSDIRALKKGEEVSILDDTCTLKLKENKGNVEKALMKINWNSFADKYFADGEYPKTCSNVTDDVNLRYALYVGMLTRVVDDDLQNQVHQYSAGVTLIDKNYYLSQYGEGLIDVDEDGHAFLTIGDYRYCISVSVDIVTPTDIPSPTDASASDASATDAAASMNIDYSVYVNIVATYRHIGEKAHPADWTWLTSLFEKEEPEDDGTVVITPDDEEEESPADLSAADILSAADAQ